ncbi:exodeoxyribonuclease V subunit alpha [Ignatzschineria rhizosphaerae]|uniref:RecBCD enzyme subunit RecD n=1 Tax=Ignatzschineria rhizosphaerae TaxID=2923279 RepID=A0ABY3WWR2_9GAMM|nr:exodeoxyribonuclease V subunit alpha [Ignatzschineria rhizosphaerae]UNM95051.1 exodeoxyribonuclease V subunit alpha [Ignatzschineria rhizosphaerae]
MKDVTQFDLFDLQGEDDGAEEIAFQKRALQNSAFQNSTLQDNALSQSDHASSKTSDVLENKILEVGKLETAELETARLEIATPETATTQINSSHHDEKSLETQDLQLLQAELLVLKTHFQEDPDALTVSFKAFLTILIKQRYFSHIDNYFASFLTAQKGFKTADDYLGYWLLALLVSRAYGFGHTAFPSDYLLMPEKWLIESDQASKNQVLKILLEVVFSISPKSTKSDRDKILAKRWEKILAHIALPLVRTEKAIYLERNYHQEGEIVSLFKSVKEMPLSPNEINYLQTRLDHYFGVNDKDVNWQKFAAANAILNNISVISGGPGTGKTTTVFKILQTLIDLHDYREEDHAKPFSILLAAPTGKAAARLSESILGQVRALQQSVENAPIEKQEEVREQLALIPHIGQTLHRLLVIHPFTRKPRYNQYNPLNFDLLVVDEASMIDQQMLVQLIGALPMHGRVIFLGDKDQLASVEAGAIMHELCVSENYSAAHFAKLEQLLSEKLPKASLVNPLMPAFNYLSFLKKSYRFKADSSLGRLASIVNNSQGAEVSAQFKEMMDLITAEKATINTTESLLYTSLPIEESALKKFLINAFKPYVSFLKEGQGIAFAEEAFRVFSQLGVLSARRTGVNGAVELNALIRKTLFPKESMREFFHGLPIMVTHNSVENNLFNGDIGLILRNEAGELRAYFEGVDSPRVFSIHALPKFETSFAMTIHKSQGSEFEQILLFLGAEPSVFLTKELFYTGITRAKKSVHIFASDASIKAALSGRVDRYSFIHERLSS